MNREDIAIKVNNIGKRYRIGAKAKVQDTFAGVVLDLIKRPLRNYRYYRSLYKFDQVGNEQHPQITNEDIIWAVKDITFEVRKGELLGIIGTNGAGKSTLLKILSKITSPTYGSVEINGRVSSLLEVGTGFHQELTGRENIYLNGTILGMRKKEIDRKFDEIVSFSGVERFLDTPVKRFSSGMRVRLAFAVAAHLEPEILIIDEVLAVGDAAFQKKCISKMEDVGSSGRTVLFVSHSMPAITRLCKRVILLNNGQIAADGKPHEVVNIYLRGSEMTTAEKIWPDIAQAPGGDVVRLRAVRVRLDDGSVTEAVDIRKAVGIEIEYEVLKPDYVVMPTFSIWNSEGVCLFISMDQTAEWKNKKRPIGRYLSTGIIPPNFFSEGTHTVTTSLWTMEPFVKQEYGLVDVVSFQVIDSQTGDTSRGNWTTDMSGVIRPMLEWKTVQCF